MSVRQLRTGQPCAAAQRLLAGQLAVQDLRARTSIVAVEGALQLRFQDHSLAWLGDAVPVTSIALHEGEYFVTPQRGVVSISAMHAHAAAFALQRSSAENKGSGLIRQALRQLAGLVKTRWGRAT